MSHPVNDQWFDLLRDEAEQRLAFDHHTAANHMQDPYKHQDCPYCKNYVHAELVMIDPNAFDADAGEERNDDEY